MACGQFHWHQGGSAILPWPVKKFWRSWIRLENSGIILGMCNNAVSHWLSPYPNDPRNYKGTNCNQSMVMFCGTYFHCGMWHRWQSTQLLYRPVRVARLSCIDLRWLHKKQLDYPDSKVHGANMGPIWGRQYPSGPYVGPMNLAIWVYIFLLWHIYEMCSRHIGEDFATPHLG